MFYSFALSYPAMPVDFQPPIHKPERVIPFCSDNHLYFPQKHLSNPVHEKLRKKAKPIAAVFF
jgi:hypothetical protein